MDGDIASSNVNNLELVQERTRVYDVLVDFQTGGNFPVLVGYIYKFVN